MQVDLLVDLGGVLALLTLAHFIADWVFQTHYEAMHKTKSHLIRAGHCSVYTGLMTATLLFIFGLEGKELFGSIIILFISHFIEDSYYPVYLWAKYIRREPRTRLTGFRGFEEFIHSGPLGLILLITIDQIIHITFLIPIAWFVIN